MNVTLKQIDAFLAVARTLNFSKAAAQVSLSQPALSSAIRKLEEGVGARLFDRSTHTVSLSPVGQEFLVIATELLASVDRGMDQLRSFVAGKRGRLAVAVAPSLAASFLPALVRQYAATFPEVEIKLHDVLSDVCIDMLRAGTADLALTPKRRQAPDLRQIELFQDHLVVLTATSHPAAGYRELSWSQLKQWPLVSKSVTSNARQIVDEEFAVKGWTSAPTFEVEHVSTMLGLIREGLGVGVTPRSLIHSFNMDGLAWRPLQQDRPAFRVISAITLTGRSPPPTVQPFVDLCLRRAGEVSQDPRWTSHEEPI